MHLERLKYWSFYNREQEAGARALVLAALIEPTRWFAALVLAGALLMIAAWSSPALADDDYYCRRVGPIMKLERQAQTWRTEVETQNKTIADMERILEASAKSGGKPPDIKRLNAMGQAGSGVVGVGKTKPVEVQKLIKEYESLISGDKTVDDHLGDVGLQKSVLLRERKREVARRKKELNYPADKLLPNSEMRGIRKMALGRAVFVTEIKRSREIRKEFQGRFAEINKKRMAQLGKLGMLEREKYRYKECSEGGTAVGGSGKGRGSSAGADGGQGGSAAAGNGNGNGNGNGHGSGGGPKSAGAKPDTKDADRAKAFDAKLAELEALFDAWEARISTIATTASGLKGCDGIGSAGTLGNDISYIERRLGAARSALEAEEQRNKALAGELSNLSKSAARVGAKVAGASAEACRHASSASLNASASAGEATRASNLKRLLDQLAFQASAKANSLASGGPAAATLAELAQLEAEAKRVGATCQAAKAFGERSTKPWRDLQLLINDAYVDHYAKILNTLSEVRSLQQATIEPAVVAFDARKAFNAKRRNEITRPIKRCLGQAKEITELCQTKGAGTDTLAESAQLKQRAQAAIAERQALASRARKIASDLAAKAKTAQAEAKRARDCVRTAEAKEAAKTKTSGTGGGGGIGGGKGNGSGSGSGGDDGSAGKKTVSAVCADLQQKYDGAFNTAQGQYAAGDFKGSIKTLEGAKATVARLNGTPPCIADTSRLDKGIAKAAKMDDAFGKIDAAIGACDAAKMASYSKQMSKLSNPHPLMAGKIAKLDRVQQAVAKPSAAYAQAQSLYAGGNLGPAKTKLIEAKTAVAALNGNPACTDLVNKINRGINRIDRLISAFGAADAAIKSCNISRMEAWRLKFVNNPSHPLIRQKIQEIEQKRGSCQKVAANTNCQDKYGSGYSVSKPLADGSYYCIPDKATANAWCAQNNQGSGWYARNIRARGGFDCRQNKVGRNARCSQKYGAGWYAGEARSDGTFNCRPGKSARNANCRQYGRGWYAGKMRRDGTYDCYGPRTSGGTRGGGRSTSGSSGGGQSDCPGCDEAVGVIQDVLRSDAFPNR